MSLSKNSMLAAILLAASTRSLSAEVVLSFDAPPALLFARDEIVRAAQGKSLPTITLEVRGSAPHKAIRLRNQKVVCGSQAPTSMARCMADWM